MEHLITPKKNRWLQGLTVKNQLNIEKITEFTVDCILRIMNKNTDKKQLNIDKIHISLNVDLDFQIFDLYLQSQI